MNDSEIIGMFFERNQQAIAELEKKYSSALTRTAENILGNRQDAQECVNDAYLGVWNTVPPQEPESLCGYACRIVRNLALKKYHTNTAQKRNSRYDVALDELENCFSGIDSAEGEFDAAQTAGLDRKSVV